MNPFKLFRLCSTSKQYLLTVLKAGYSKHTKLNNLLLSMPKDTNHTVVLKTQRVQMKEKRNKYAPGRVSLQVLGSGAKGAPRALYLFSDQSRYLFNCGEGTQRLAHEHKMKLSKLEHIFLTYPCWENVGGLPGVALTIQDVGVPEITLHGPQGIDEIFTATRRFVVLKNMAIQMAECTEKTYFIDNAIKVKYLPLRSSRMVSSPKSTSSPTRSSSSSSELEGTDDDIDYYAYETFQGSPRQQRKRKLNQPIEQYNKKQMLGVEEGVSMCYAVELLARPGSLCLEKCVEQGVPPGPLLGRLKAGQDVVLDNGKVVRSQDVTQPPQYGPVFIVVDCPTEDYLSALEADDEFCKHQAEATDANQVAYIVVHFTPAHIVNQPIYKNWMDKFSLSTHHLMINDSNTCMGSVAVHRVQEKLHLLQPSMFPLLQDPGFQLKEEDKLNELSKEFSIVPGRTFTSLPLRPKGTLDGSETLKVNRDEYVDEVMRIEGFQEELEALKKKLGSQDRSAEVEPFPNVLFLGTGSCIPNKTRNTSSILLNISDDTCMLLDCGEGTYGQLCRFYGTPGVDGVMAKLRAIYVSHLHADHHIGLIGLIKARARAGVQQPLYLLAPSQIMTWLKLYNRHFEGILRHVKLVPNAEMLFNNYCLEEGLKNEYEASLNSSHVETTRVRHCPNSFGVSISHKSGWKITYSGDTMPCESLITLGEKSDLLIHEATMEDELEDEAKCKMHSTTSQAIAMGKRMGARFTLLTHFSQRYAKLPRLNDSFTHDVGIAFDNMQVSLQDLSKLPLLYPALRLMFQEECDELEQKALKRQLKQEREQRNSALS